MPALADHSSSTTTKLLYLGNSGSGKTGSLASLARAGYNLRIADFDNGLDFLAAILRDEPEALARVRYKSFTDKFKLAGNVVTGNMSAFTNFTNSLNKWKDGEDDLGHISTWTDQDVLVIDSMTFMCRSIMNMVLQVNNKLGQNPSQPNWGDAMRITEDLLAMLYDTSIKCNIIVISHIVTIGEEEQMQGFPAALGNKLPPKIPRFFNTMVEAYTQGVGSGQKRKIRTRSRQGLELKVSNPKVPQDLPLETGLADMFKIMRG